MIVVLCPHFQPDTAPTGDVMRRIVHEFVAAGQRVHVVTALPWYRTHAIEPGWGGRLVRREQTSWGSIIRVHPFPGKSKKNILRRAIGFALFSVVAGVCTLVAGGWRRPRAIIAMSPPLTLGLTGWLAARLRRTSLIFNIQDVFPDAAVATGAITNSRVIAFGHWLERVSYHRADAVVVLSEDLRRNVEAKIAPRHRTKTVGANVHNKARVMNKVHVIPNFVDVDAISPRDRMTTFRREWNIGNEMVVMYAGNVGYSQSLEMLIAAARAMPEVTFVINGDGAARADLQQSAKDLSNIRFTGYQPRERVAEVLSSADVHVVPLRAGLGAVSVPSKTYSILAAGRAVVAAIDDDTEVTRILAQSGAGVSVPPDDTDAFVAALRAAVSDPQECAMRGARGRQWVEAHVSPASVATEYLALIANTGARSSQMS